MEEIRAADDKHTIIVGPAGWNSFHNLATMPEYSDDNLIYTFHCYGPFLFTHQGAGWVEPSMVDVAKVPFPYDASRMPQLASSLQGTWVGDLYKDYPATAYPSVVESLIDIATEFKTSRNVAVFCGEFGVYIPNSEQNDRIAWYEVVRKHLKSSGLAWTM